MMGYWNCWRRSCLVVVSLLLFLFPLTSWAQTTVRVNAGGGMFTDSQSQVWDADRGFNAGNVYRDTTMMNIPNAPVQDQALYKTERWIQSSAGIPLIYEFAVTNGLYKVNLHFAEVYVKNVGDRIFSVKIQGVQMSGLQNVDIISQAGGDFLKLVKTEENISVTNGKIVFEFVPNVENPKINAIEILPMNTAPAPTPTVAPPTVAPPTVAPPTIAPPTVAPPTVAPPTVAPPTVAPPTVAPPTVAPPTVAPPTVAPPMPAPPTVATVKIFVNAGGVQYTDTSTGNMWIPDTNFISSGSLGIYRTTASITNAGNIESIYQTERHGPVTYNVGVTNGVYDVVLHFAEIYFKRPGDRVFNVNVEGVQVFNPSVDLVARTGGSYIAMSQAVRTTVNDSSLTISLQAITENPKISGFEIRSVSSGGGIIDQWIDLNESEDYTKRHECSFVQAGDKFYLFGGRENPTRLEIYNYATNTWSVGANVALPLNHFQATEYQGLIWVIGAFKNNAYPDEDPAENVFVYSPANDIWMPGPLIPRQRGSAGLVVHNGKFYVVGGNDNGHRAGAKNWLDEYDPVTGTWKQLQNAPRARDHFHAVVIGSKMYCAGGRRTNHPTSTFNDTVPEVDVYDFSTGTWATLPNPLPNPRAASATAVFDGKIFVIGGEKGDSANALKNVDALDPSTGQWSSKASLKYGRHGTQAIVSGEGIFVAAGSPLMGAGQQWNLEVYNKNTPTGFASVAGSITAPSTINVSTGVETTVIIQQSGGNQGVFVNSVELAGAFPSDFTLVGGFSNPVLITQGGQLSLRVRYSANVNGRTAQLGVTYNGNQVRTIRLAGVFSGGPSPVPSATPPPTPTPAPLSISNIQVVNADTNGIVGPLINGCNGCGLAGISANIKADAFDPNAVGSMELTLSGPPSMSRVQQENVGPYALYGDKSGDYLGVTFVPGQYTLTVKAFPLANRQGTPGPARTVSFSV